MTTRTDALDEALERLTGYVYQDGPGLACHGPMGAEAISSRRDQLASRAR